MSRPELERLVQEVEADRALQRALKHCRSRKELILAVRRLGYRITRIDLEQAWREEQREAARAQPGPPTSADSAGRGDPEALRRRPAQRRQTG